MILDECTPEMEYIYSMFFQFAFENKGQNLFPDNHCGGGGGAGENNVCE